MELNAAMSAGRAGNRQQAAVTPAFHGGLADTGGEGELFWSQQSSHMNGLNELRITNRSTSPAQSYTFILFF